MCPSVTLLVLSALALAQPVSAQPLEPTWVFDWFSIGLCFLVLGLLGFGVWLRFLRRAFSLLVDEVQGDLEWPWEWDQIWNWDGFPGFVIWSGSDLGVEEGPSESSVVAVDSEGNVREFPFEGSPSLGSQGGSSRSPRDLVRAHEDPLDVDPLRAREEFTGLTLVQRARLRKQLQEGGVVEPPVMRMRYGGLPPWVLNEEAEASSAAVQIGGSSSCQDPLFPAPPPVEEDEPINQVSAPQPTPNVQIGGSSSSSQLPVHVCPGDFEAGSLDSISRIVSATGGRRILWRVRDERDNILRRLLSVCGEVLIGLLGDRASEIYRLAFVARTFEYGVHSSLRRFWTGPIGGSIGGDATMAYVQGRSGSYGHDVADLEDDPSMDDVPHRFPDETLPYLNPPQPFDLMLYLYGDDSSNSDPVEFSTDSEAGIDPSEPEHEPSVTGGQLTEGFTSVGGHTAGVQEGTLYGAEEEYLLVFYLDDVYRVHLPGWSQSAIQTVIQGMHGQGGWTPSWTNFFAAIEGSGVPQEQGILVGMEPTIGLPQGPVLAIENATSSHGVPSLTAEQAGLSQEQFLLAIGGFGLGMGVSVGMLSFAVSFVELSPEGWILLACHASMLYRAVRFVLGLLWGGLRAIPEAIGFDQGSVLRGPPEQGFSRRFMVWVILIMVLGMASPSAATAVSDLASSSAASNPYEEPSNLPVLWDTSNNYDVIDPNPICLSSIGVWSPSYVFPDPMASEDTAWVQGWWWLGGPWVISTILVWEFLKWAVCRTVCRRTKRAAESQTEAELAIVHPIPEGVPNRANILYCLWRAGLSCDVQLYPEEVQDEFFGFVGSYQVGVYRDEDSSE